MICEFEADLSRWAYATTSSFTEAATRHRGRCPFEILEPREGRSLCKDWQENHGQASTRCILHLAGSATPIEDGHRRAIAPRKGRLRLRQGVHEDALTIRPRLITFLRLSGQKQVLDLTALVLDRGSPVPLYFQIERLIEQAILSGRAGPGTRVPSEPSLAEHFGVSRSVVRQSLVRLEQEGFLSRFRGRGSFVRETERRSWRLQGSEGFFQDEVDRLGRSVTSLCCTV